MATSRGTFKVVLEGRGPLTLRDADYVASGGEGSIYRANATVVKIFTDPNKMKRDGMVDKVNLLSAFNHPSIIAPQGLVLQDGKAVGYYMAYADGEAMSKVFGNDYRTRNGFGDKDALVLVDRMRDVVDYVHDRNAVMVDPNELNWRVQHPSAGGPLPQVVDVDSWAIGKWPAKAIMDSIRDWKANNQFNSATDWFAWGVVTFQVFTGIHPYKGKLDGYKPGSMVDRMKANASVFTPGVRLPHVVRDFNVIPGPLLDWYQATFQQGVRQHPPSPFDKAAPAKAAKVLRATVTATGSLVFERLFTKPGNAVVRVWPSGAAWLQSGEVVDMNTGIILGRLTSAEGEVVKTDNGWLLADWQNSRPEFSYTEGQTNTPVKLDMVVRKLFRSENRLFIINDQEMMELQLSNFAKPLLTIGKRWQIMPNSTQWFDGMAVADMLGAKFLYLPVEGGGMHQSRVRDLDSLRVVTAKAGNRFVAVIAVNRRGEYRKLEFTFDKSYGSYTLWEGGSDTTDLNAALLPRGVVASILEDGELVIFVPTSNTTKKVQDGKITTAMQLTHWDDKVVYLHDGNVWRVSLK